MHTKHKQNCNFFFKQQKIQQQNRIKERSVKEFFKYSLKVRFGKLILSSKYLIINIYFRQVSTLPSNIKQKITIRRVTTQKKSRNMKYDDCLLKAIIIIVKFNYASFAFSPCSTIKL